MAISLMFEDMGHSGEVSLSVGSTFVTFVSMNDRSIGEKDHRSNSLVTSVYKFITNALSPLWM